MATQIPAFNFDFSAFTPLINRTLAAYDFKVGRLPTEAAQGDLAFKEWRKNQEFRRGMDMMSALENYRQARGRETLAERGQDLQERQYGDERSAEDAFVRGEQQRISGLAARYGASLGMPRPEVTGAPARLAWRGRLGGADYRGTQGDDALGNTGQKALDSMSWHAQICRVNPSAPGCPGTWG
jgi:hypothetical protein